VVLSTIGTIETYIIQFSRVLFAKSRDNMAHEIFSRVHSKWLTPYYAIMSIWALGVFFIFLSSFVHSINELLSIIVLSIGIQFSFYVGLTAISSAWHFREYRHKGILELFSRIILPFIAGVVLLTSIVYASLSSNWQTNCIGVGGILIGLIPYYFYAQKNSNLVSKFVF
jgi:amino acid transporter